MAYLVLEKRDEPWFGHDSLLYLLHEPGLPTLETVVQINEHGQERDPLRVGRYQ